MSFAQAKFKQLNPNELPPRIREEDDPFNDQAHAASYVEPELSDISEFVQESSFSYGDVVIVVDPTHRLHRYTGIVSGANGGQIQVRQLARGLSDRHGDNWNKGANFIESQLQLRHKASSFRNR